MIWVAFFVGLFIGGAVGVVFISACRLSGEFAREEEIATVPRCDEGETEN